METNIELYDIQKTRQYKDTLTMSDQYIQDRLQFPCQSSMKRNNSTRITTGRDQSKSIQWMSRQRLHASHAPRIIEDGYFNSYLCILCKL